MWTWKMAEELQKSDQILEVYSLYSAIPKQDKKQKHCETQKCFCKFGTRIICPKKTYCEQI